MKRRANGDGTILKRKDGRWMAQAYVTLSNGERKRICITAKEYETVRTKLREALDREKHRLPHAEKNWTVAEYLDYWLNDVQKSRIRETTMAAYTVTVNNHLNGLLPQLQL